LGALGAHPMMFIHEHWSKEGEERINEYHYYHQERGFYKSWLYNLNILCVGSVKQGCDI
jgi:hypothetical protein